MSLAPPVPRGTPRAEGGVIAVSLAAVRRRPDHASELVNQLLLGEAIRILGRTVDGRWLRARSEDGYTGWVRGWSVAVGSLPAVRAWRASATWRVRVPFWDAGSPEVGPMPFGARLARAGRGGGWLGPCGELGSTRPAEGSVGRVAPWPAKADGRLAVRAAMRWRGTPYVWGGRTAAGIDCSGLSQWAALAAGVLLPRDARLQCAALGGVGALAPLTAALAGGVRALRAGDLWFFGPRSTEVTHVAISRGGLDLIHAYGRVCLGSLDPASDRFEPELFSSVLGWTRLPGRGRAPKFA